MIIQPIKIIKCLTLLLLIGLAWGEMFNSKGISFGVGDSETGISIFGLSLSKHFNEKHAVFLGAGTFGYVNPICIGLKQYSKKTDNQFYYSFFSIQYTISRKNHIVPTLGIVSERILKDNSKKIKLGLMVFQAPNGFGVGPILRFERNF